MRDSRALHHAFEVASARSTDHDMGHSRSRGGSVFRHEAASRRPPNQAGRAFPMIDAFLVVSHLTFAPRKPAKWKGLRIDARLGFASDGVAVECSVEFGGKS